MYVYVFNMINRRIGIIYVQENYHLGKKNIPIPFFLHLNPQTLILFFRISKNNIKTDTK